MLCNDYQAGVIYMKGNQKVRVPLNYDAGKRQVMYQQNGENMILTNPQMVDSMRIGKDLFCRVENAFYEVVDYPEGKLLIDWNLRNSNIGYKGAYGTVSQVRSQSVKLYTVMDGENLYSPETPDSHQEVYKVKNNNKYLIVKDNRILRFSNKKSLLKLTGDKSAEAEAAIAKCHTDFTKAEDVIKVVGCLMPMF